MNEKVSICIPTYNQVEFLKQAIYSAKNQKLAPYEIIVSNDCSTDDTANLLKILSEEIQNLKVINQPKNLGIAKNTDACLRMATGDYIVRLDSDDYLAPFYTKILVDMMSKFPEAAYSHAAVQEVDKYGHILKTKILSRAAGFQTGSDALLAAIKGYRVAANIIMFRRTSLKEVNYITNRPDYTEDYHLSASFAAANYGNVYSNNILSFYRVWSDQGNIRQKRKLMEITGVTRVFEEILQPAFVEKGWKLSQLKKNKGSLARMHSDCLSWKIYNAQEKCELLDCLKKLSSTKLSRLFYFLNLHGFGIFLISFRMMRSLIKQKTKFVLYGEKMQSI